MEAKRAMGSVKKNRNGTIMACRGLKKAILLLGAMKGVGA